MKTFLIFLVTILFFIMETHAQSLQTARPDFGRILKAPDNDTYSRVFAGAVHIGPAGDDPVNTSIDYASVPALEDALLFVETGIATENMTYIFEEYWDEWPDYVFEEDYDLNDLNRLEQYIKKNKHLPEVPSRLDVKENGVSDRDMTVIMLKKIEELTLYTIDQNKKAVDMRKELEAMKALNAVLLEKLSTMERKFDTLLNDQ